MQDDLGACNILNPISGKMEGFSGFSDIQCIVLSSVCHRVELPKFIFYWKSSFSFLTHTNFVSLNIL